MSDEITREAESPLLFAARPQQPRYRRTSSLQRTGESTEDELDENLRNNPNVRRCYFR